RALERLRQRADLIDQVPSDDVRVVREGLRADVDGLAHAGSVPRLGAGLPGPRRQPDRHRLALAVAHDLELHAVSRMQRLERGAEVRAALDRVSLDGDD